MRCEQTHRKQWLRRQYPGPTIIQSSNLKSISTLNHATPLNYTQEKQELRLQLELILLTQRYACDIVHHLLTSYNQITANGAAKWLMNRSTFEQ